MIRVALGLLFGSVAVLHFTELLNLVTNVSILLITVSFLIYFKFKKINYLVFILAIAVGFFMTSAVASYQQSQSLKPSLEGKDLLVNGYVDSLVKVNDINRSFVFKVASASVVKGDEPTGFQGRIRLSAYDKTLSIKAGEQWQLQVRLKRSSGFKNPGSFDYEKWLFAQGIHAKGYLRKSNQHKLLATPAWYSINSLRESIHKKIKGSLGESRNFALVSALILAEKSDLSKENWEVFRTTGTSHLMAISGLHIGLVASGGILLVWLLWWCFPRLNLIIPQRLAGGMLGVVLAIFYALLAGMTIPTQRALILVVIGLILLLGRHHFSAYRILALTMILVLIADPLAVMSAGFYLSFSAVLVILWLLRRVIKAGRFSLIKLQCFLSLLMIPLSLCFFGEGSLVSPIANLIAIPWVSFIVVPLSMLSVLLSFLSESLAFYLFEFLSLHLEGLYKLLAWLSEVPSASIESFHLPPLLLAALVVAGVIMLIPVGLPWRYAAIFSLLPLVFFNVDKPMIEGGFVLTVLDVGQGSSAVVETKNHTLVFDAGDRASDSFDIGEMVVVPYLKRQSIKTVDALVISHDDRDHVGGAEAIIMSHQVDAAYGNRLDMFTSKENEICESGQQWVWDGVTFEFLHPELDWQGNDNNRSCVLKVSTVDHSVLLTGDIQRKAEKHLLKVKHDAQSDDWLEANILLMPHHGSNTSSQKRFIKAVNPTWAIASAGYRSRFKHPAKRVVNRYESMGVKVLTTAVSGAIQFQLYPGLAIKPPQQHRLLDQRFWSRR